MPGVVSQKASFEETLRPSSLSPSLPHGLLFLILGGFDLFGSSPKFLPSIHHSESKMEREGKKRTEKREKKEEKKFWYSSPRQHLVPLFFLPAPAPLSLFSSSSFLFLIHFHSKTPGTDSNPLIFFDTSILLDSSSLLFGLKGPASIIITFAPNSYFRGSCFWTAEPQGVRLLGVGIAGVVSVK